MTKYAFNQLVDIENVRKLLKSHYALMGLTYAILDTDENILVAVGWQDICVKFHRVNPVTCANCRESDAYIKTYLLDFTEDFVEYRCKNGMIDVAMPIIIDGEHVATFFSGQFFYEDDLPDTDFFRTQAEELGFDRAEYLNALERVPVYSRKHIHSNMLFLCDIVKVLARIGLGNLKLEREVEERNRTEATLEAREHEYRTLAENSPDNIIRFDRQCRAIYINSMLIRTLNLEPARILGKTPVEILGGGMNGYENVLRRVLETGAPDELELALPAPSGGLLTHHVRFVAERDQSGEISGILAYGRDITERKLSEDTLKESEFFFKESQRSASIGSYKFDFNTGFWESSEVMDFIFGIDKNFNRSVQGWLDIVHPDDRDMMDRHMREDVISNRKPFSKEYRIIRNDDRETRWVHGLGQLKFDRNGDMLSMMGTIQDITERKRGELEQQLHELRMSSLYEISQYPFPNETDFLDHALNEVIRLTESRIGYIYFYDEQKQQFGLNSWSKDVMKECMVLEKMTIYDLDNTGIWGEAVRQKKPIIVNDFKTMNPIKKGYPEGHVNLKRFLTIPVIANDAIVAVVGVANKESDYLNADVMQLTLFMDSVWKIVDRKRMEEAHLKLEKQLLHTQKLESLGVLAGGIAHDFNNILVSIIGNADLALMKISPESPASDNLRKIEQAASRAADLSKQMLAYSGKGKFVIQQTDMNRVLEEMLHMLEVSISKKITLRLNLARPLPAIEADITQMHQVVMNLIINASEAIGNDGGTITIATSGIVCDKDYLNSIAPAELLPEGKYVVLEVADTGCGMDQDTMAKIFDPFFTTKFTGRGLGMAAVHGIIRGHKGAINVYSEPGKGSIFRIFLPASTSPASNQPARANASSWHGIGTILLVDDEEIIRNVGCEMLEALGFESVAAVDGFDALEIIKHNPSIKIVILDLTMPRMDGEQTFNELRKLNPNIQVIMSSGYNEQEVTQKFVGKRLAGFIQKPYRISVLREVLSGIKY